MVTTNKAEQKKRTYSRTTKRLVFYVLIMALPVLQFCIFYIYVNFNSFALAFQTYTSTDAGRVSSFAGFDNFKVAFEQLKTSGFMFKNSLLLYACNLLIGTSLALFFSFYLAKKYPASGLFKVILFMPQIISSVVLGILFKFIANDAYSAIVGQLTGLTEVKGLLDNDATAFGTLLFYNVWVSFGTNVLMYTGAMSGINESVVESAQLDGANVMQEFFHITIPMIFPTLTTFIVVGLAGIFTNQMNLYTFFKNNAGQMSTMGYFLYVQAQGSDVIATRGYLDYPQLSALGLILTLIVLPLTLGTRKLLEKYGPSTD